MSYALRDALPVIRTLREMKKAGIDVLSNTCPVHCQVFEDNAGAIEIAKTEKYRPRTKHINIKLHHFRSYVRRGVISISKIAGVKQQADILTKPVPNPLFANLRKLIMGW